MPLPEGLPFAPSEGEKILANLPPEIAELVDVVEIDNLYRDLPPMGGMWFRQLVDRLAAEGGRVLHIGGDFRRSLSLVLQGQNNGDNPLLIDNIHQDFPHPQSYRMLRPEIYRQHLFYGQVSQSLGGLVTENNDYSRIGVPRRFDLVLYEPQAFGLATEISQVMSDVELLHNLFLDPGGQLYLHRVRMSREEEEAFRGALFSRVPTMAFTCRENNTETCMNTGMPESEQAATRDLSFGFRKHPRHDFLVPAPANTDKSEHLINPKSLINSR